MGNYSFTLNMFSNQSKDNNRSSFQSVLPKNSNQNDANKKRKLSFQKTNKTAPSPPITDKLQVEVISDKKNLVSTSLDSELNANFEQTESQLRRERMADCEFECSEITNYLYVGGYYIAGNRELLREKGITYIINCSSAVVENHFIDEKSFKYLSFSLVDGRQDDISWFLCEVIKFITGARSVGGKVLIHCEKGISRSCSFAIAYYMWSTGYNWKACFDYVKSKRKICAPNTAFTCNLIELGDLLSKDNISLGNLIFRCSYHLSHDPYTPCLKLCRNQETRKIIHPSISMLDTKGVYIIRSANQHIDEKSKYDNSNNIKNYTNENEKIYIWCGMLTTEITKNHALVLSKYMYGVFIATENIKVINEGKETKEFLNDLENSLSSEIPMRLNYDDYFDYPPSLEVILSSSSHMEADHTSQQVSLRSNNSNRPILQRRESSIKGFELFNEQPLSLESNNLPIIVNAAIVVDNNNTNQIINLVNEEQSSNYSCHLTEPNTSSGNSIVSLAKASRVPSIRINSYGSSALSLSRDNSTPSKIGEENNQTLGIMNLNIPSSMKDHDVRRPSHAENLMIDNVTHNNTLILNSKNEKLNIKNLPSYCESPVFEHLNSSSTRPDSILSLETIGKRNENYISPENSFNVLSSHNPFKKRFSKDKDSLQINNSLDENNIIEQQEQQQQNDILQKKSLDALDVTSTNITTTITTNVIPIESNSVNIITEQATNIIVTRPDSKNSSRPNSAVFSSRNKVAPLNITNIPNIDSNSNPNTARSSHSNGSTSRNRTATSDMINDTNSPRNTTPLSSSSSVSKSNKPLSVLSTLLRMPSHTLSPVINTLPTTIVVNTAPTKSTTTTTTNNVHNSIKYLNLPITERTGTPVEKEKHPENISLSRAPTPIEDLTPIRIEGCDRVTPIAMIDNTSDSNTLTPSDIIPSYIRNSSSQYLTQNVLVKPLLYQAISSKQSRLSNNNNATSQTNYEWQAMGVYDDEDLDDDSLFLLLCPNLDHFIWVGKSFSFMNKSNCDNNDNKYIISWVSSVYKGEVKFEDYVGNNLITNKKVSVIMSGTETDLFWQSFNEGY